jgi:microsomal dipeptidase-like Zn-dependent dipeptidase
MAFNIDIHCHPSTKPFMSSLDDATKTNPFISFNHNIEDSVMQLLKGILAKKAEVQLSAQSNFDHLFRGGHRVVIASITPMERGFFVANDSRKPNLLADAFIFSQGVFANTIKPKLINALMGFSTASIEFVRNSNGLTSYFKDGLLPEFNYLKKFHNKKSAAEGYTLKLVNSFSEIEAGMNSGENALYVLLSIEGAHSFKNTVPVTSEIRSKQGYVYSAGELNSIEDGQGVENNIIAMKKWKFVPLFITVMHHFWNGMGGHARSLNKMVGEMLNQQEGINQGLSATGKLVIRNLLRNDNGPRVLVDIKHMSIASRREFYQLLDTDPLFKNKKIPILCSHTGIASNIDSLNELQQVNDKKEEDNATNYFHKAQINLCGEDIRRIANSGGLIGIQLDEKRIAGAGFAKEKFRGGLTTNELRNVCSELIMSNVFMVIRAINTIDAWNICCIGSDYDGLINHLDPFPTSEDVHVLRDEIEFYLDHLHDVTEPVTGRIIFTVANMKALMMGLTAKQITEKVFSANVMAFLKKNFNR